MSGIENSAAFQVVLWLTVAWRIFSYFFDAFFKR